ncbi:MAG: energy-coupling factor transporter transmembrane protein EcfT [Anaerolineae bacterium]|nr:energy-coupling factor transporter transmembrane protein EcfT [Anaerolineae bacterium]
MSEFEFLGNVTIGQYLPTGSSFHRLDPRAKIIIFVFALGGLVTCASLIGMIAVLFLVIGVLALARIPLRYALRGLRPVLPFLILLALMQVFALPANDVPPVLWQWWRLTVTVVDLQMAALALTRFVALILVISLFSFAMRTVELTHGVEHLLRPLQRWGLPAHELALIVLIALRFVPLLAMETERLAKAQASRGADFGSGKGNVFKRAVRLLPLLVPLFLTALHRAEALALAMEARCYTGGSGRTNLIQLHSTQADWIAVGLAVLLCIALVLTIWFNPDVVFWSSFLG